MVIETILKPTSIIEMEVGLSCYSIKKVKEFKYSCNYVLT